MIDLKKEDISKLSELLKTTKTIAIVTHSNPDGDAIGSALGLFHILKNAGHKVQVVTPNSYPDFLQWLPGNDEVIKYSNKKTESEQVLNNCDLIFALDFNDESRLGKMDALFKASNALKVLIDHHPYPKNIADISFSYTKISSTAELVYLVFEQCGLSEYLNKDAATCLYTGIMTDTGCFNYNCSYPSTFKTAGLLIEQGIKADLISTQVYDNYSKDRIILMGYCLNEKMEVLEEYHTAIITLTKEEQKKYKFKPGDSEGFVNLPLSIKNIKFSIFIMEKKDVIKLSFRSKGSFPANKFASEHFSGGGHVNAAGGESNLNLELTISQLKELIKQHKTNLVEAD